METSTQTQEEKFELAKLNPNNIAELDQWEAKLNNIVKENPYIEICDKKTFEEGKRRRTALKSGRTDVEKQDGFIATFLNNFRKATKQKNINLVAIVHPHELKQQAEIDRFQKILDDAKAEEDRIENERIDGIKGIIQMVKQNLQDIIEKMTFETIEDCDIEFDRCKVVSNDLMELRFLFDEMVEGCQNVFNERIESLKMQENERIENASRKTLSRINEICLEAQSKIDSFITVDEESNLIEIIDDTFGDSNCFRPHQEQHKNEHSKYVKKAMDKIDVLNQEALDNLKKTVSDWKDEMMDMVLNTDTDNFEENKVTIEEALKNSMEEPVKEDFEKAKKAVLQTWTMKKESLEKQIEERDKFLHERLNERIEIIQGLGMVANEDESQWTGFDLEIYVDRLFEMNSEECEAFVKDVLYHKDQDESEKQRQERIRPDKIVMVDAFTQVKNKINETKPEEFDSHASFDMFESLKKELFDFCDQAVVRINKF